MRNRRLVLNIIVFFTILMCGGLASAEWTLKFTCRDIMGGYTNSYKEYSRLSVLVDGKTVESFDTISGDYQYGSQTLDITPYIANGRSKVSFRLDGYRQGLLLYDIELLHDGLPVRFSPWNLEKSQAEVRGFNYSDTRLVMMLGDDLVKEDNFAQFTTQPLADAPELEIRQSDLRFSKPAYKMEEGEEFYANVTVRNVGGAGEANARIEVLIDGKPYGTSDQFPVPAGAEVTKTFNLKAGYGGKKFVKIEARIVPSDELLEGKAENNQATKYLLKRPSMFFTNISQTYAMNHLDEEPYARWFAELKLKAEECQNIDYASGEMQETIKSGCLMSMALYYQLSGDESYAESAVKGLSKIGDGKWTWADRTKAGHATKNSLDRGVDENYGLEDVDGAAWGQIMVQNALAYDWVHDYAIRYDDEHGTTYTAEAGDRLAHLVTDTYLLLKEVYSYGDHGTGISAFAFGDYGTGRLAIEGPFGVAALSILDYEGKYQDLDGSPDEWIHFVEKDLAVESQTGARIPNLDQHMSADGLYEEGEGYRDYYEPGLSYFVGLYNNVLGVNMAEKYEIVDGSMSGTPVMMSPPGRYPNICVSYGGVWYNAADSLMVYEKGDWRRSLTNYYIAGSLLPERGYRPMGGDYGMQDLMLLYDASESKEVPDEPSYFSPHGSVNILRSGFDKNSLYSFLKAPNEPTMSGHAPYHYHQLSFDLWAKGAYPIVDAGDERYLGYGGSSIYGHTTWLFYEEGKERWIDRDAKGQYGRSCNNPAYITSTFTSADLDYVRGEMDVRDWYYYPNSGKVKNPFKVSREMMLVGDRYLIVADTLTSVGSNTYSMVIPLGSTEGHSGEPGNPKDNWVIGNLTIDGVRHDWFDVDGEMPVNIRAANASEMVWETLTETNKLDSTARWMSLTADINPPAEMIVNVSGMHYGEYGQENEWAFPYVRVNQAGSAVAYLTVYYPTAELDTPPRIQHIELSAGKGYATRIIGENTVDTVLLRRGDIVSIGDISSDARLSFERIIDGRPSMFFFADGSMLIYRNTTAIYSTEESTAQIEYEPDAIRARIEPTKPMGVYIQVGLGDCQGVESMKYDGKPSNYSFDGSTLYTEVSSPGNLTIKCGPRGEGVNHVNIIIPEYVEKNGSHAILISQNETADTNVLEEDRTVGERTNWGRAMIVVAMVLVILFAIIMRGNFKARADN
jgi:hypothetical protein